MADHSFPQTAPIDDAQKIINELIVLERFDKHWASEEQRTNDLIESTRVVPAKNSLKIKLVNRKSLRTL